jgi:outer membrane protein assembly factor BamB
VVIDCRGSTIVAGRGNYATNDDSLPVQILFAAKFNSLGKLQWQFITPDVFRDESAHSIVEGLDSDPEGNVVLSARPSFGNTDPFSILKLSANNGNEIWRRLETHPAAAMEGKAISALKSDHKGNTFFMGWYAMPTSDGGYSFIRSVRKYDRIGTTLWTTVLPGEDYVMDELGVERTLAVTRNGDLLVVGIRLGTGGFATKIDSKGKIQWFQARGTNTALPVFDSVHIGRFGTFCAASGYGYAVFTSSGHIIATTNNPAFSGQVFAVKRNGDFLLNSAQTVFDINLRGKLKWFSRQTSGDSILGAIVTKNDNVITAWHQNWDLDFARFDQTGSEVWRGQWPGQPYDHFTAFSKAPDGTVRIVLETPGGGFRVVALSLP